MNAGTGLVIGLIKSLLEEKVQYIGPVASPRQGPGQEGPDGGADAPGPVDDGGDGGERAGAAPQ